MIDVTVLFRDGTFSSTAVGPMEVSFAPIPPGAAIEAIDSTLRSTCARECGLRRSTWA